MKTDTTSTAVNEPQFLLPSAEQYLTVLRSAPAAVYICNKSGYITFFNEFAEKMWGRAPVIGKELWCGSQKIFNPDGSPLPLDESPMAIILKKGISEEGGEIIIERADGFRINIVPHVQTFCDEAGIVAGAIIMLLDITERKSIEATLAQLASIVQFSDDAIISKSLEGIITSWNAAAERIFGYTEKEMIGTPVTRMIPHDRQEEEPAILKRLRNGERVEHFNTKRITKNNTIIDISLTISPIRNKSGQIIGASKIARDITKIIETDRLIREAEERFRMAVDATKMGTWDYDPVEGDLSWSEECKKIYGFPSEKEVSYDLFARLIHPDDKEQVQHTIEKAMAAGSQGNYDISFRIIRFNDGKIRWIRSQGKVYFNTSQIPARFIGTVLDITVEKSAKEALERVVLERTEALRHSNEQLQQSNAELERFAAVASHDLQEPLRKIQTYADLIINNPDNKSAYDKWFPKIMKAAARMSQLIGDVLHYAKVSGVSGKFENVDMNELVRQVLADFELIITEKKAKIIYSPLPSVDGNRSQLNQLLSNLMSNSLKFSSASPEITIAGRIVDTPTDLEQSSLKTPYAEITFSDNGIGFDPQFAEQVFVVFQRLNTQQEYRGTGIGLAICKKVVENHHGTISVNSKFGEGTVFTIQLPLH